MSFRGVKRLRVYAQHSDQLITKQSCKAECDINNILSQYKKTGIINHITKMRPDFVNLPPASDYQESLNLIMAAQDTFDELPALVRDHFKNDPALFLAAFSDEKQHDYLREHGFINPVPAEPGPLDVRIVNPEPPTA
jgi:phage internal scaffolding protein